MLNGYSPTWQRKAQYPRSALEEVARLAALWFRDHLAVP